MDGDPCCDDRQLHYGKVCGLKSRESPREESVDDKF